MGTNSGPTRTTLTSSEGSTFNDLTNSHQATSHITTLGTNPLTLSLRDKPHPNHGRDLMTKSVSESSPDPSSKGRAVKAIPRTMITSEYRLNNWEI
jgi:hypothetical protein